MPRNKQLGSYRPRLLHALVAGLFLVGVLATAGCDSESATEQVKSEKTESSAESSKTDQKEKKPEKAKSTGPKAVPYKVEKVEDLPFANVKRFTWHVVVSEEATVAELKATAKKVVEEAKSEWPFNALSIMFYDHPESIGRGFTLGKSDFAPDGDWAKADSVRTGDYDAMSFTHELRKKDWGQRLTSDEIAIWKAWYSLYDERAAADPVELPDEDQVAADVATEKGVSVEEVDTIISKAMTWQFMDD